MTPTKQEMIGKIYRVIADKTLSIWCLIRPLYFPVEQEIQPIIGRCVEYSDRGYNREPDRMELVKLSKKLTNGEDSCLESDIDVIWHPVMINRLEYFFIEKERIDLYDKLRHILNNEDLLKPIEEREENKIKQLYDNLLILWCISIQ